jgi:glycosyltransferase involved in cell wall biosynthesis
MDIKISVVIPTFSRPKLLTKCLDALMAQSIPKSDFEVIVVSDGPDKETLIELMPWLKKKKLNLSYEHTSEKKGPAAARNLGWLKAKAPLVAFTDDDCLPDKAWLAAFLHQYQDQSGPVAYTGQTRVPLPKDPTDFELNTANLQDAEFITANCACSKTALISTGGFDERFKLAYREDSDLQFKFLSQDIPIRHVPEALVVHPVRNAPWGISIKEQKKGCYDALLFRKFPALYKNKIHARPLWNYYMINLLWILLFVSFIVQNKPMLLFSSLGLILLLSGLIARRLKNSRKSINHILEMIWTSIFIPTLSVYWRIYGAIKFRVLFI